MFPFNVRVYGILRTEANEILITDERTQSVSFTKFPGGGLEYGEGLIDALKREFLEECNLHIDVIRHIYTTDFYEKSSFNNSQIISVYYEVQPLEELKIELKLTPFEFDKNLEVDKIEVFRLVNMEKLKEEDLTFKTDKKALEVYFGLIKKKNLN
ncbi:NUDIX domain-containing protein [Sphingobacterium bovistauri]|uniref:NUDIX domain-containing protein n=1 Tax=Sphingobacterium bovistauri TaxID=2781959 RepID=A0ABS7Z5J9_9SPHI|nr:NUDIX domain-containing protein [Sphingobacterium bovistauri]MCA5004676.1 NUDIX domain-containing protein [Sphingobacterium bovistauri]